MRDKEKNFLSAVIYMDSAPDEHALGMLDSTIGSMFQSYELIIVVDPVVPFATKKVEEAAKRLLGTTVCIVAMGKQQGLEASMNAGIDAAVGDYILEVDDLSSFDPSFLREPTRP